jgi:CheY-like chemotaxis protein
MTHKLLIIDDHPETLDIISRVLQQQGYAVIATASAVQGLTLAEE